MDIKRSICFLIVLCLCSAVFAVSYTVDSLNVNVEVGKNAVHRISENYEIDFRSPAHGIERYIPVRYRTDEIHLNARLTDVKTSWHKEERYENGYRVLRLGSENTYLSGVHSLSLSYSYDLGPDNNEGYDEFYLNLVGTEWDCFFKKVDFSVEIPGILSEIKADVFRGDYGGFDKEAFVSEFKNGNTVIRGTVHNLSPGEALTIRITLPENWYVGAEGPWDYRKTASIVAPVLSFLLVALATALWYFNGKDREPIVTARYNPPEGMTPLAVGYLADESVDDKDITSMLYYWADKGLLKITALSGNKYVFTKTGEVGEDSPEFERRLFNGFFRGADKNGEVTLESLKKYNFYSVMQSTRTATVAYFSGKRRLKSVKSSVLTAILFFVAFLPAVFFAAAQELWEFSDGMTFISLGPAIAVTAVQEVLFMILFRKWYIRKSNTPLIVVCSLLTLAEFAILFVFADNPVYALIASLASGAIAFISAIMPRRSEYGQELLEGVLGYREFIDKVSVSELKMLIDGDPEYYYRVLSFAIVLGLEDKWAKKFASLAVQPPVWYSGVSPLDVYFYTRMSRDMSRLIRENAMNGASQPVGGVRAGGGSIGGFAGGGFGGGGGRAW